MSHNPNTVKSQDEINQGGRKSDVLLEAISKAERLQKQLDIAVKALENYANEDYWADCFSEFNNEPVDLGCFENYGFQEAQTALAEIKELDNENS